MPASYLMSWEPKTRRWTKMHEGKRYAVTCRQLTKWTGRHVVASKEGSYQAANAWWMEQRAKIEAEAPPPPHQADLVECKRRLEWCRANGRHEEAAHWDALCKLIPRDPEGPESWFAFHKRARAHSTLEDAGVVPPPYNEIPSSLVDQLNGEGVWQDRLKQGVATPEVISIGQLVERFMTVQTGRVERNEMTARSMKNVREALKHFTAIVGTQRPAAGIDEKVWQSFFDGVNAQLPGISKDYASRILSAGRSIVEWAYEGGHLETLPRNLKSRSCRIAVPRRAVPTMPAEMVRTLIDRATGQLKLHLLLMANTGCTQQDISDLHPSEVDWDAGRIRRKRSKTSDVENVPEVDYKLWPETITLLREYRSGDPSHVLLTSRGNPWVIGELGEGGKVKHSDNFASAYDHWRKGLKQEGIEAPPAKIFRKTSASMLDNNPDFGDAISTLFLGHSPKSIKDRHYSRVSVDRLDNALAWLHSQYFTPLEAK